MCSIVLCSFRFSGFSWIIISSIHKHEFHAEPRYYRPFFIPGISVPQFFGEFWNPSQQRSCSYQCWMATEGLIIAVFLDNPIEVEKLKKDRGMPWWVKFRTFGGDNRNEEIYFAI